MALLPDGDQNRSADYDPPPPTFVTLQPVLLEKLTPAEQETYKARIIISAQLEWLIRNMVEARREHARLLKRHEFMENIYKLLGTLSVVGMILLWLLGDKVKALLGLSK